MGHKIFINPSGKWIVGGAIILALGVCAVGAAQLIQHQSQERGAGATSPAVASPAQGAITALGRIEPEGEVINVSGPSGERVGQLLVKEKQWITQGQAIAHLESHSERQVEVELAQSRLKEAQALWDSERRLGQAQIQEARTRMQQVTNPKSKEILAQTATIDRLNAELALAAKDFQRFQDLQQAGAVSLKDLDDRALALRSKQEDINNAKAILEQLQQEQQTNLINAKAQLQSAEAGSDRSQTQVQVNSAVNNLKLAQARLERTIIRAPRSGKILKVLLQEGEAIPTVSSGESGSAQAIVQMGNTDKMYVVAEVYETDIRHVKISQPARITSAAFEGDLQGTVAEVGQQVGKNDVLETDPAADTDARVVEVKIRLQDSQVVSDLTNLQVKVIIQAQG